MASERHERNTFLNLRRTIASINKDVAFLKKCLKEKLTPVSHKIKMGSHVPKSINKKAESEFMKTSIKRHYAKLERVTLECYNMHLKLAKDNPESFDLFLKKVKRAEECESDRKRRLHRKKLNKFRVKSAEEIRTDKPTVQIIEGFVVNRSTQQFTKEQLAHLNKGLGYAITQKSDVEQIIVDMETAISRNIEQQDQNTARNIVADAIKEGRHGTTNHDERRILKELKEKPVYYVKADKGNAVVVMDKEDYDEQMTTKINGGPYRHLRVDPLPGLIRLTDKTIKECKAIIGEA
ncbi:uncharacterized protein LOC134210465 [Armigeres subalbatus]|uniref:uncharacterized protein LOC134210465 n=1 Tax=Armigeres subalbatus TaxID=124917 RepID=UPI002ED37F7F